MATVRMWTLVGLALLCTVLTVQADDDETTGPPPPPGPGGEMSKHHSKEDGDDHFGYKHDDDDDDDDDDDCDDHHDDDDDDHGRKGDDMHNKDDKEENNEHSKKKRCGRKKIAKILIIAGLSIAIIGTGVGVAICCVRHKRQMRRNVSDSRTNLHVAGARENVYVVKETKPEEKPSVLAFPVVSHAPLPGKE